MTTVTLGITGGIAAYKIPDLVRQFRKVKITVRCIATETALRFVSAETLAIVSEAPVVLPGIDSNSGQITHLDARRASDLFIVAPATANFIAKAAAGMADSPLLSSFLAFAGPKLVVPAMHDTMWLNPATQRNIAQLKTWGIEVIGPDVGDLASGDTGPGRMIDPSLILTKAQLMGLGTPRIDSRRILIGLGGTREHIDPVRVITNLSTGKLGTMLTHALALQGAEVTAISTVPIGSNPHVGTVKLVTSSEELKSELELAWPSHELLYMPAAISDFKPAHRSAEKMKRSGITNIELEPTADIVGNLPRLPHQRVIGFCLQSESTLRESAIEKLNKKHLDAIVANTPDQFGSDQRNFWIITPKGETEYRGLSLVETASVLVTLGHSLY